MSSRSIFAYGMSLARARIGVKLGLVFVATVTIGMAVIAALMASRGRESSVVVVGASAEALAWFPGMLVVFTAALRALRADFDEGAISLALSRGVSVRDMARARVVSLGALVAIACGAGTAVVALAAAFAARSLPLSLAALHAGAAGILHGAAFGFVLAPVALATLGARSRGGGYALLVLIVVVPEFARFAIRSLPSEWIELLSIPSALDTLRRALSPGHVDVARALAAFLVLALVGLLATAATVHQTKTLAHDTEGR